MAKAVVITGASTGIGRTASMILDRQGFRVFAGVRRPEDGEALRAEASDRLSPLILDVTDAEGLSAAAKTVEAELGEQGLHGLVNNAGIGVSGPLEVVELAEVRRQLEVNVIGQIAATQAFLPAIRQARGRIVFIGSLSGYVSAPFTGPYSASKHALEAIADALRCELHTWGIEVSLVDPGNVTTPIWEKTFSYAEAMLANLSPRGRELYGEASNRALAATREAAKLAVPPEAVVRAILHALSARRPRTRYRVGRDAKIGWWASRLLPDRLLDRMTRRTMGQ